MGREVEPHVQETVGTSKRPRQEHKETYSFYNDTNEDDVSGDSEEDEEDGDRPEEREFEAPNDVADGDIDTYPTEAEKRRERRHAQAAREREGERHRRAGLPRNYLLIDEHTMGAVWPRC